MLRGGGLRAYVPPCVPPVSTQPYLWFARPSFLPDGERQDREPGPRCGLAAQDFSATLLSAVRA